MATLGSLSACHTDPFGLEPEVDVTLPEDRVIEPGDEESEHQNANQSNIERF
ncbi:MAG: hypothetical protein VYC38_09120 [Pseudomonadota bacterium]|nr:hypothetical protein [Pseudomonadota bacterium]